MKNLKLTVSAMMVIMSISGMSASFRFFKKKNNDNNKPAATVPAPAKVTAANPASQFCVDKGGKSIIVKSGKGDYGVCMLKDGTAMEEWEYYRQNHTARDAEAAENLLLKKIKMEMKEEYADLITEQKLMNGIITEKITN